MRLPLIKIKWDWSGWTISTVKAGTHCLWVWMGRVESCDGKEPVINAYGFCIGPLYVLVG